MNFSCLWIITGGVVGWFVFLLNWVLGFNETKLNFQSCLLVLSTRSCFNIRKRGRGLWTVTVLWNLASISYSPTGFLGNVRQDTRIHIFKVPQRPHLHCLLLNAPKQTRPNHALPQMPICKRAVNNVYNQLCGE